jgi:hypothetical protein
VVTILFDLSCFSTKRLDMSRVPLENSV